MRLGLFRRPQREPGKPDHGSGPTICPRSRRRSLYYPLLTLLFAPSLLFADPWTLPQGSWKGGEGDSLAFHITPHGNLIFKGPSPETHVRYAVHVEAQVRNEYWVHPGSPELIEQKKTAPDNTGSGEKIESGHSTPDKNDRKPDDTMGSPDFNHADRILFYYDADSLTLIFFKGNSIVKNIALKRGS